eukprot:TRINITY_DN26826_c0_g3_i1.p1 TRINITY_DN26826_c0_g3~~TRINITY_DN26826_c0_g3_i1.p1  ORF type:complete len:133 (-),score=7.84 TRINITY_DN26826_c0_g3_i1:264-662(-)
MAFATCGRWARCRSAHLSSWARQANASFTAHARGLASISLMATCAEMRPPSGFPEQRINGAPVLAEAGGLMSEAEGSDAAESLLALVSLIDGAVAECSGGVFCSERLVGIRLNENVDDWQRGTMWRTSDSRC